MAAFTSIPIIDIGPLVEKSDDPTLGDHEDVAEVVRLLDSACKETGFFYAKSHGVPASLTDAVLQLSHEFFHLSYEEKLKIKMSSLSGFRGYQKIRENVTEGKGDIHEAIDYYKEFEYEAYGDLGHPLFGPNLWPQNPSRFKDVMEEYIEVMKGLSRKILRGIALALGGPPDVFEGNSAGDPFWVMRVIGYPPLINGVHHIKIEDSDISCGAHTDYGLLTLVNQDTHVCALQVRNQSGDWIWAPPVPGAFVVNIGDMLKILSNGIYKPTLHRVINKNPRYRVSVPFFLEPNFDALIEPLEFCRRGTENQEIKPAVYGKHLVNKVTTNFG